MTERQATGVSPTPKQHDAPSRIDRRGFFRGAAALTVGGLGATTELHADRSADRKRRARGCNARARRADQPRAALGRAGSRGLGAPPQRRRPQRLHRRRRPERPLDRVWLEAQRRGPRRSHRPGGTGPSRHLAHDRAHASIAHAEDDGRTGARQSRVELPRVVRNAERPGLVRCARPNSAPGLGRLPRLVPEGDGHDGAVRHAARRNRAAR